MLARFRHSPGDRPRERHVDADGRSPEPAPVPRSAAGTALLAIDGQPRLAAFAGGNVALFKARVRPRRRSAPPGPQLKAKLRVCCHQVHGCLAW